MIKEYFKLEGWRPSKIKTYLLRFLRYDKIERTVYLFIGLTFLVTTLLLLKFILILKAYYVHGIEFMPDMAVTGQVGDFIGGVIGTLLTFLSILLLLITLKSQRKFFERERFENRFYEMLRIHRENIEVLELQHSSPYKEDTKIPIRGRNVFSEINATYIAMFYYCKEYCEKNKIEIDYRLDFPNAIYLILFYGCEFILHKNILDSHIESFEKKYPKLISHFVKEFKDFNSSSESKFNLDGMHEHFGHYYRHLYQTVNFVHKSISINSDDKKCYLKILRSQMGDSEQAVFFYNSISDLGSDWELTNSKGYRLISTYQLIKNIPKGTTIFIDPMDYYPDAFKK